MSRLGQVTVITGCMYAGKTTALLELVKTAEEGGQRVLMVKHRQDQRYDATAEEAVSEEGFVRTHTGRKAGARQVNSLAQLGGLWQQYDIVAVDEGCFFGDLLAFAESVDAGGKQLLVAGLDTTFTREPFGEILALAARAGRHFRLTAVCRCGQPALYTERTRHVEGLVVPGGAELYRPACGDCHRVPEPAGDGRQ